MARMDGVSLPSISALPNGVSHLFSYLPSFTMRTNITEAVETGKQLQRLIKRFSKYDRDAAIADQLRSAKPVPDSIYWQPSKRPTFNNERRFRIVRNAIIFYNGCYFNHSKTNLYTPYGLKQLAKRFTQIFPSL